MSFASLPNPFLTGKYLSEHYFCPRPQETQALLHNISNGRNTVLTSIRGMGKSSLLAHVLQQPEIKDRFLTVYCDLKVTSTLTEFVLELARSLCLMRDSLALRQQLLSILHKAGFHIDFDAAAAQPYVDFSCWPERVSEQTLEQLLQLLESADRPAVVVFDSFEQIAEYQQCPMEALLRTYVQRCTQTYFVFAGDKPPLISPMFLHPDRPFYNSALLFGLSTIPADEYLSFAQGLFAEHGKKLEAEAFMQVYTRCEGVTGFVQAMLHALFACTEPGQTADKAVCEQAMQYLLYLHEASFREQLSALTARQRAVLCAIACYDHAEGVVSAAFVHRHGLQSASSVQTALRVLLDKGLVLRNPDRTYRLENFFLRQWLQQMRRG